MAEGRSLIREILKNFKASFKLLKNPAELKGRDHFGTEYYEGSVNPHTRRPRRWFSASYNVETKPDIPSEWQSWLTHKRLHPPTEEEIQINIQKMKNAIEKSKKMEMERNKSIGNTSGNEGEFPKYEEFSSDPGK